MPDAPDFLEKALQARSLQQKKREAAVKEHEFKVVKALDRYRKAQFRKLPRWWWTGAFRDKLVLAEDLARLQNSLDEYKTHCANQAYALRNLYQWALSHDPGDSSLDDIKKMLGPIQTPNFNGGTL